jgi:hypothetical protein
MSFNRIGGRPKKRPVKTKERRVRNLGLVI